jgi:hypothetical protein
MSSSDSECSRDSVPVTSDMEEERVLTEEETVQMYDNDEIKMLLRNFGSVYLDQRTLNGISLQEAASHGMLWDIEKDFLNQLDCVYPEYIQLLRDHPDLHNKIKVLVWDHDNNKPLRKDLYAQVIAGFLYFNKKPYDYFHQETFSRWTDECKHILDVIVSFCDYDDKSELVMHVIQCHLRKDTKKLFQETTMYNMFYNCHKHGILRIVQQFLIDHEKLVPIKRARSDSSSNSSGSD